MGTRAALAAWFEPRRSLYPWRGERDPYRVLVSEVMLQQTQATRVVPSYLVFVDRFPDLASLAAATRRDVLLAWAGLGYNRRAVALHEAARAVVERHGGAIPCEPPELEALPGIGAYTAAAVASIAFGRPVPAIDTNVRRVVARARLGAEPHEVTASQVRDAAWSWLERADPGGWNQAVMDMGRESCRPAPRSNACPLAGGCRFHVQGRDPSPQRPGSRATAWRRWSRDWSRTGWWRRDQRRWPAAPAAGSGFRRSDRALPLRQAADGIEGAEPGPRFLEVLREQVRGHVVAGSPPRRPPLVQIAPAPPGLPAVPVVHFPGQVAGGLGADAAGGQQGQDEREAAQDHGQQAHQGKRRAEKTGHQQHHTDHHETGHPGTGHRLHCKPAGPIPRRPGTRTPG